MCLVDITEPVSPGVTFLCAAQDMAILETWCFIAALPKANFQRHGSSLKSLWSIGARRSARKRMESNGQPFDSRSTVTEFLNLIPRVNAKYALGCWHQNWIKGSCANALFLAPLAIPAATVFFSPKPSPLSQSNHAMSVAPLPPKASHRSSADSAKVVDAIPVSVGQPSAGIYDQDDDYYPPNNWARIRLATSIIYYSP
jgi:hypothetical protein